MNFQTPTRVKVELPTLPATPESNILSSPLASFSSPTPNYWGTPAGGLWPPSTGSFLSHNSEVTPRQDSKLGVSLKFESKNNSSAQDSGKRGRPRADLISHLILEGTSSPSGIKCRVCNRVFPREKSLQAHLRTHTGERPYLCDYPGCTRAFTQSGQLKTHQRLHAGEKPFVCSSPGCGNRYTHANRTCPAHPLDKPIRSNDLVLQPNLGAGENTDEVQKWLECYRRERMDKTPAKNPSSIHDTPVSPMPTLDLGVRTTTEMLAQELCKRNRIKRGLVTELEQENVTSHSIPIKFANYNGSKSPVKPGLNLVQPRRTLGDITPKKDKNILPPEPINNHLNIPQSPVKSLKPKKRWIKTVVQEQKRQETVIVTTSHPDDENLAMPISWNENESPLPLIRRVGGNISPLLRRGVNASPVHWSVVSALVDLSQATTPQPLNLSTSGDRRT